MSPAGQAQAATDFWPEIAVLLGIISQITRGQWKHLVSSTEALDWRPGDAGRSAALKKRREQTRRGPL